MLACMFNKISTMFMPSMAFLVVIGCAEGKGNIGGAQVNEGSWQTVTPSVNGTNYSSAYLGTVSFIEGIYVDNKCKKINGYQTGPFTTNSISLVLNDVSCQLMITKFTVTGSAVPANNGTYSGASISAATGSYTDNSGTFTCSGCHSVYAKARLVWSNGAPTIDISYATDPAKLLGIGTGTYATSTAVGNSLSISPTYNVTYIPGFTQDTDGYIQAISDASGFKFTYNSSASNPQTAEYYTVLGTSLNTGATYDLLSIPGWDSGNPVVADQNAYDKLKNFFFDSKTPSVGNVNKTNFIEINTPSSQPLFVPFYAPYDVSYRLTSTFGLLYPVKEPGTQLCGKKTDKCSSFDGIHSILNDYKGWTYSIPTYLNEDGLTYYVLLVHLDTASLTPAFQFFTLKILPVE